MMIDDAVLWYLAELVGGSAYESAAEADYSFGWAGDWVEDERGDG